jgi:response regulator RpfG family c-di-GMP phosphodiesterase
VAPSVLLIEDDARLAEILGHHMDGLEVCRQLRAKSAIPVLMLTARSEAMDRVVGLEICADDYLPKRKDASDRQHLRDAGDDSSFRLDHRGNDHPAAWHRSSECELSEAGARRATSVSKRCHPRSLLTF